MFIKQCKATDSHKMELNKEDKVYTSIKHDGVYLQIHKQGDNCKIYFSSGKELNSSSIKDLILATVINDNIILECEYTINNNRSKADNELKAIAKNNGLVHTGVINVFDIINDDIFKDRIKKYKDGFVSKVELIDCIGINLVKHNIYTIEYTESILDKYVAIGEEGFIMKYSTHAQMEGKKSKLSIKLKPLKIADLKVTNIFPNGYLELVDENGIMAKVKSTREANEYISIGTMIEISYDFIGNAYNQAVFRDIRLDKKGF